MNITNDNLECVIQNYTENENEKHLNDIIGNFIGDTMYAKCIICDVKTDGDNLRACTSTLFEFRYERLLGRIKEKYICGDCSKKCSLCDSYSCNFFFKECDVCKEERCRKCFYDMTQSDSASDMLARYRNINTCYKCQ